MLWSCRLQVFCPMQLQHPFSALRHSALWIYTGKGNWFCLKSIPVGEHFCVSLCGKKTPYFLGLVEMGSIRSLLYFISQQLAVNFTHCWLSFGADTVVPAVGGETCNWRKPLVNKLVWSPSRKKKFFLFDCRPLLHLCTNPDNFWSLWLFLKPDFLRNGKFKTFSLQTKWNRSLPRGVRKPSSLWGGCCLLFHRQQRVYRKSSAMACA